MGSGNSATRNLEMPLCEGKNEMSLNRNVQQVAPSGEPCPSCGKAAVMSVLNFEITHQAFYTAQGTQGVGKGTVGYSLCLACLDRHKLIPNPVTGKWMYEEGEEQHE